jgi:DNA-binding LacI/PurR family transcriptional regulator
MGRVATRMLLRRLDWNLNPGEMQKMQNSSFQSAVLPVELIVRQSTAPPAFR